MPELSSIRRLYEQGERAKLALANLRRKEKETTNELVLRAGAAGSTVLGNVLAGAIDGKWGHDSPADEREKYNIAHAGPVPINIGLGLVALALGVSGVLPGSEYLSCAGGGMFGYALGKMAEAKTAEKK